MNELDNEEHREALQLDLIQKSKEYHGEEFFDEVTAAAEALAAKGIKVAIFAESKMDRPLLAVNNFADFMEFENGVVNLKTKIMGHNINYNLAFSFVDFFARFLGEKSLQGSLDLISHLAASFSNRLHNGVELPAVEKLLEEENDKF